MLHPSLSFSPRVLYSLQTHRHIKHVMIKSTVWVCVCMVACPDNTLIKAAYICPSSEKYTYYSNMLKFLTHHSSKSLLCLIMSHVHDNILNSVLPAPPWDASSELMCRALLIYLILHLPKGMPEGILLLVKLQCGVGIWGGLLLSAVL